MRIYGINPVVEALRAGRVGVVRVARRSDARLAALVLEARRVGVSVERVDASSLDRDARGGIHQGVVAMLREADTPGVADLVGSASDVPLIVVLDGIEDPHNVGAILR